MKTLLHLQDVWKSYQMGEVEVTALKGINLEIEQGEFVAITGSSGSGKSTMMNLIGCLDLPSRGKIYLDGTDIETFPESKLAQTRGQKIGFIFQQFNLVPTLSAIENVMLPLEFQDMPSKQAKEKAEVLLRIIGLGDRMEHRPSQLSGGQMQRVAIARALAVEPEIILADEPTGNLDSETGKFILDFLINLHKTEGKTVIMVTHDLALVKPAGRIVHMKDGQIYQIEKNHKKQGGYKK